MVYKDAKILDSIIEKQLFLYKINAKLHDVKNSVRKEDASAGETLTSVAHPDKQKRQAEGHNSLLRK